MTLANKVTQFNQDADKLHLVIHGGPDVVVTTEGGPVKSLANVMAGAQGVIDELAALGDALQAPGSGDLVRLSNGKTMNQVTQELSQEIVNLQEFLLDGLTTEMLAEVGNLFFTDERALGARLAGLSLVFGTEITSADSILTALGKLQKQLASKAEATNGTLTKPTIVGYIEKFQELNPGAAVSVNPLLGTLIEIATTANIIITLPPPVAGMSYTLLVKYGGAHTVQFATTNGTLGWFGKSTGTNTAPTATMLAGKVDAYGFICGNGYTKGRDGGRNG